MISVKQGSTENRQLLERLERRVMEAETVCNDACNGQSDGVVDSTSYPSTHSARFQTEGKEDLGPRELS
jgi:hypothetical protein